MNARQAALFQRGAFKLHSGDVTTWKVECDALTAEDWEGLAAIALDRFSLAYIQRVIAVPRGGVPFAEALRPLIGGVGSVLVVDDVLTTGASMRATMRQHPGSVGLVAFARGPLPPRVMALWSLG